jgi:antitoxin component YwqK of YwqJK toxin-antitoxin module
MIISLPKITLSVVCIILLTLSWGQVRDSSNTVRFLYPNGLISSEGELINNQPHGVWKSYFTDGKIKSIVAWNFGKLEGVSEFFSTTGFRTTTYAYLNHLKTGPAHFYDSVGSLIREVVYVNDTLHGPAI